MRFFVLSGFLFGFSALGSSASGQWQTQDSGVTADLRSVDSVSNGVAWASGAHGTVLRTENMGQKWQVCAVPPAAKELDLRGIQGIDSNTALVMSIGTGETSRLYKTIDGCHTWKEVFRNPDEKGSFDAMLRVTAKQIFLLGEPVSGKFAMFTSRDAGDTWFIADDPGLDAVKDARSFAVSNSALGHLGPFLMFGAGGVKAQVYIAGSQCDKATGMCTTQWQAHDVPIAQGSAGSGVYSLGGRLNADARGRNHQLLVAVGGSSEHPNDTQGTGAASGDGGATWTPSQSLPGGYRSAVGYDRANVRWIAVGPNGTDVSTDDGVNWKPLKPDAGDAADADKGWSAVSLPFVVGPKGRVGILREAAPAAK